MDSVINLYNTVLPYATYPIYLYLAFGVFVFVLWLFGTDLYDAIVEIEDGVRGFHVTVGLWSLIFLIPILLFDLEMFAVMWSLFVSLVLALDVLILVLILFKEFNSYCLKKRGKIGKD